jgi:hypothetical protein
MQSSCFYSTLISFKVSVHSFLPLCHLFIIGWFIPRPFIAFFRMQKFIQMPSLSDISLITAAKFEQNYLGNLQKQGLPAIISRFNLPRFRHLGLFIWKKNMFFIGTKSPISVKYLQPGWWLRQMLSSNFVNCRVSSESEGYPHQSTQRLPNPVPLTSKNLPVASYYLYLSYFVYLLLFAGKICSPIKI